MNAKDATKLILKKAEQLLKEKLEKAEDSVVGHSNGKPVYEKKLKEALKAHNSGKESPTANEHWNEAHGLGDSHHRGVISLIANSKHGLGGSRKKISAQDIKDHWPMHFNEHYGQKKDDSDLKKADGIKGLPQPPHPAAPKMDIPKAPTLPKPKMPSMGKVEKPLKSFIAKKMAKKAK
jgi:hypothetical protein